MMHHDNMLRPTALLTIHHSLPPCRPMLHHPDCRSGTGSAAAALAARTQADQEARAQREAEQKRSQAAVDSLPFVSGWDAQTGGWQQGGVGYTDRSVMQRDSLPFVSRWDAQTGAWQQGRVQHII